MLTIDLSGKTALVLGGSRGIGAGITEALCAAGAYTVFTHTGRPEHRERVAALGRKIEAAGGRVREAAVDALDSQATDALVGEIVAESGRLDILVCNVGKNQARTPVEIDDASWREFLDLNLTASFYGVRAALPVMERQGYGRIVLIGSSAVYDGGGGALDYAAAKAALTGMMAYLCRTYLKKGILTNIVHPCVIETDLLKERYGDPEKKRTLIEQIPVGRLGQPEDIAGLTAFLCSSWGDYICGQEILADGGRTIFNK
ncbi:MAG: SDR family oxidoreductase [Spirochaetales bacterium]|nr:SDR family oxidoreductase [Spirochaetales bacterium]